MTDRKAMVGGKIFDVITYDQYVKNKDILLSNPDSQTAVEYKLDDGSIAILPIRSGEEMQDPGLYNRGIIDFFNKPATVEEKEMYCPGEDKIFEFGNAKNLQELLDKKQKFDEVTNQMLETPDNITMPPIMETDTPAMRALKEAVIAKKIDLDKYKERFGANFPNDKRKLSDNDITLFILDRYAECLDMQVDLIISDKSGNIANPMNKKITANLVPGSNAGESVKIENS